METTPTSPPELLLKLNKLYTKHHQALKEQQERLKADPVAEQIDVAFNKYIFPLLKKAANKGLDSLIIDGYQINLDFITANLSRFEKYCQSHDLKFEPIIHTPPFAELRGIKFSGWDAPLPKAEKPEGTLTDRISALEQRCEFLDRELQNIRAGK